MSGSAGRYMSLVSGPSATRAPPATAGRAARGGGTAGVGSSDAATAARSWMAVMRPLVRQVFSRRPTLARTAVQRATSRGTGRSFPPGGRRARGEEGARVTGPDGAPPEPGPVGEVLQPSRGDETDRSHPLPVRPPGGDAVGGGYGKDDAPRPAP